MQESKQDEYLDITSITDGQPFEDIIKKIRSLPNKVDEVPFFCSTYLKNTGIEVDYYLVFSFKFHNIITKMYMSCLTNRNIKVYSFFWLPVDHIFDPDIYSPLSFDIMDYNQVYSASLSTINTRDFKIPTLEIGHKKYKGMTVPVVLGLTMISYLGINTCNTIDVSHVNISYTGEDGTTVNKALYLLDQRSILGTGSIYEKYGFERERKESPIGELTLQDILDDYGNRLIDLEAFIETIKKEDPDHWKYYSMTNNRPDFYLGSELLKRILREEDRNISLKTWLTNGDTSVKSILLFSLVNSIISWKTGNKDSAYYREPLRFYKYYTNLGTNQIYSPDIKTGLRKFLSK
jgi:hypothetical protein